MKTFFFGGGGGGRLGPINEMQNSKCVCVFPNCKNKIVCDWKIAAVAEADVLPLDFESHLKCGRWFKKLVRLLGEESGNIRCDESLKTGSEANLKKYKINDVALDFMSDDMQPAQWD